MPLPSSVRFLRVWLSLGLQSFGGGMATLALVRRAVVEQEQWITEAEFSRFWALVQLAPGINLVALIVLIGRHAAGTKGIALALFGLLAPSVTLTILLTAFYVHFQHTRVVQEAADGIIPAIVGLGLVTAWQIVRPLLTYARRKGRSSTALSLTVLVGSGLAALLAHLPVIVILGSSAAIYAAWNWWRRRAQEAAV